MYTIPGCPDESSATSTTCFMPSVPGSFGARVDVHFSAASVSAPAR